MSNQYYIPNSLTTSSLSQSSPQDMPAQNSFLSQVSFDPSNPEARCACVLLFDTSRSMAGDRISELNQGLIEFQSSLQEDELASVRVELAVLSFGNQVKVEQDFVLAEQFQSRPLYASGSTPMGQAVNLGLDMIEQRKQVYRQNGVAYYRPWFFLITDGAPTDEWRSAANRVRQAEARKSLAFFAVGVQDANMNTLQQFSMRPPIHLKGLRFRDMFVWLSKSLTSVSRSQPGEQVPLDQQAALGPMGWGEV